MADQKIDIDLSPQKVIDALKDISNETKKCSEQIEDALGKHAPKSIGKLEEAAERGTTKITGFFRNLGQRVREDLKTAFDMGAVLEGAKFAKGLGEGVKQVFEMERAFDRLNVRLKMSADQMTNFKNQVGRRVAATGQKLEDVLPGVETAAAKGGVKSPQQLASIAESLGQAKATTGEDVGHLSDTVVEILKNQGEKVTAASFKKTLDALQGTRVQGAFHNAGEAGDAVKDLSSVLSPAQAKKMGLGGRELGGLAAMASRGGEQGQTILKKILETATQAGGKEQLNAIFGQQLFKGGKLDTKAFSKINPQRMGQFSEQALSSATGANQADLARFLKSMKEGQGDFQKVVSGSNETAEQFKVASDNFASQMDQFKERMVESGREMGEALSHLGKDVVSGNFKSLGKDVGKAVGTLWENKGTILGGLALTAGVGMLAGGGLKSLLGKVGGAAGGMGAMGKDILVGQALKQAGIQPVFVVNAAEIAGSKGGVAGALDEMGSVFSKGAAAEGGGMLATAGEIAAAAAAALPMIAAVGVGAAAGYGISEMMPKGMKDMVSKPADWLYDAINPDDSKSSPSPQKSSAMSPESIQEAVAKGAHEGTVRAHKEVAGNKKTQYTNPSAYPNRGTGM